MAELHPNNVFDQVYLINLPRRADRLSAVLWELDPYKIKVKIIEAVDGYHPQLYGTQEDIPPGAFGYFLSWKKVISDVKKNKYTKILILDDDVLLRKDFLIHFSTWMRRRESLGWKILLLGATQHAEMPLIQGDVYIPGHTDGSFAVALNGETIINDVDNMIDPNVPKYIDSDIMRSLYQKYSTQCFVAFPNLIIAQVTESDIRKGRDQEKLALKIGWNMSYYNYPLLRPLVSIIVPCYKGERTIKRCLESLLDQTYRPLEIIVVDDGSSDKSFKIITNMFYKWQYSTKSKDFFYKIIKFEKNSGPFVARNAGIDQASGQLIGFQDADDISLDYRIEDQVNHLLKYNVNFTTCLILRTHLHYLSPDPVKLGEDIQKTRIHNHKYCCRSKLGLITTLFRREIVKKLGHYLEWPWGADAEYVRRLFPDVDKDIPMMNYLNDNRYIPDQHYCVPEILYLSHEMTDQNLTHKRKKAQKK